MNHRPIKVPYEQYVRAQQIQAQFKQLNGVRLPLWKCLSIDNNQKIPPMKNPFGRLKL